MNKINKKASILKLFAIATAIVFSFPLQSNAGILDDISSFVTGGSNSFVLYPQSNPSQNSDGDGEGQVVILQGSALVQQAGSYDIRSYFTQSTEKDPNLKPSGVSPILTLVGEASYYSRAGCLGCNPLRIMANGQTLIDEALTMAIGADKSYLVGHYARVTNLASGKSVVALITDTGGFYQAKYGYRVADLSVGTKQAIGMTGGTANVRVEVL